VRTRICVDIAGEGAQSVEVTRIVCVRMRTCVDTAGEAAKSVKETHIHVKETHIQVVEIHIHVIETHIHVEEIHIRVKETPIVCVRTRRCVDTAWEGARSVPLQYDNHVSCVHVYVRDTCIRDSYIKGLRFYAKNCCQKMATRIRIPTCTQT